MIAGSAQSSPFDRFQGKLLVIAHRGYRAWYPENTLCAFAASLAHLPQLKNNVVISV